MKKSHFLQKAVTFLEYFGLIATIALLPIDRFPYFHTIPFRLGLISLLCLVMAVAVRLYQARKELGQLINPRRAVIACAALALPLLVYLASPFWAINAAHARGVSYVFALGVIRALLICALLIVRKNLQPIAEKTFYVVTAVIVGYGLFQFFFDVFGASQLLTDLKNCCTSNSTYVFPRVHSTALEPLYLDHFLMLPIWLMTFRFLRSKGARTDKRLVALFILTATLFILTIARSATIGLICAGILFAIVLRNRAGFKDFLKFMGKSWLAAIVVSVVLIGISGVAAQFIDKNAIHGSQSGLGSIGLFGSHAVDFDDGSAQTRYGLWPKAVGYFQDEPITGVGADNTRILLNQEQYAKNAPMKDLQPFNNDALTFLTDFGLLGIISLIPFVYILWRVLKEQVADGFSDWASPFVFAFIGMAVQGNFFQSLLLTRTFFAIAMLLLLYVSAKKR